MSPAIHVFAKRDMIVLRGHLRERSSSWPFDSVALACTAASRQCQCR